MGKINFLVLDVDGTLTDGKIYIGESGEIFKIFDVKDGYGIKEILPQIGITPIIVTGRSSKALEVRCQELGIDYVFQGVKNKLEFLSNFIIEESKKSDMLYGMQNLAYCGDDCNDLDCMNIIKLEGGIVGCPKDAVQDIIDMADFVSNKQGGNGAVREFIEWLKNYS